MKKDRIFLIFLIIILAILGGTMIFLGMSKEDVPLLEKSDALKIKEEFAKLNDKVNENNQRVYPSVNLSDSNPFILSNEDEVIDVLNNKSGLILFGYSSCSYTRTLMPILESVLLDNHVGNVYYLDILNIRDELALDDSLNVIEKKQGSNGYYKLLDILDKYLEPYYLDYDNKNIDTKEKRITSPTIVVVKKGEILDVYKGTVSSQKSGYDKLTKDEEQELTDKLTSLIEPIVSNTCVKDEAC